MIAVNHCVFLMTFPSIVVNRFSKHYYYETDFISKLFSPDASGSNSLFASIRALVK
jgi:hypothetical protein